MHTAWLLVHDLSLMYQYYQDLKNSFGECESLWMLDEIYTYPDFEQPIFVLTPLFCVLSSETAIK